MWPYLHAVATSPPFLGTGGAQAGNYIHDILQHDVKKLLGNEIAGESLNDYVLSSAAIELGQKIALRQIKPEGLPNMLRDQLGDAGLGSNGRIDELAAEFPELPRFPNAKDKQ